MYAAISSSVNSRMVTRVASKADALSPVAASTTATPVITICVLPRSARSVASASRASAGLPYTTPSSATTVSAPSAKPEACSTATARALRSASDCASRSGESSPSPGVSSTPGDGHVILDPQQLQQLAPSR